MAASDKSLALASFSSRGRIDDNWDRAHVQATNTGLYRPTVTAPGVAINAAKSAAATLMAPGVDPENPFYTAWTVAVYGRINLPTAYTGSFETYVKN